MSTIDVKAIWADIQANAKALDGCAGPHEWERTGPVRALGQMWRCTHCGGAVDAIAKLWYECGSAHAREALAASADRAGLHAFAASIREGGEP